MSRDWITEKHDGAAEARVQDLGELPIEGELALWHPLDDIHQAPRMPFASRPRLSAIWVGRELAGYVLRAPGEVASRRPIGDASTDTDRFFLVRVADFDAVLRWFNVLLMDFERLGGDVPVQTESDHGTTMLVLLSPDGNAELRGGYSSTDELVEVEIRA